jgi:methyl-accepting chemotaxis protein
MAMGAASQIGNSSITVIRDVLVIQTMLEDLQRTVRILDCDIATEEASGRVSNAADPRYPMLAKTLSTRRDNLRSTIRALKDRLGQLTAAAA